MTDSNLKQEMYMISVNITTKGGKLLNTTMCQNDLGAKLKSSRMEQLEHQ